MTSNTIHDGVYCHCRCHDMVSMDGTLRGHSPRPLLETGTLPVGLAEVVCRETLLACPRCQPRHLRETGVGLLFTTKTTTRRPPLPQYPRGVVPPTNPTERTDR